MKCEKISELKEVKEGCFIVGFKKSRKQHHHLYHA